jgi:DNA-binding ferritin-like protein
MRGASRPVSRWIMTENNHVDLRSAEISSVVRDDLEERDYLLKRVRDHLQLADNTEDSSSRSIHQRLAALYDARAGALGLVQPD